MDNFDDLLGSSRAALEENPFADDPFSRPRSGFSDPWSTPFGATDATSAFESSPSHFDTPDTLASHTDVFEATVTTNPEPVSSLDPLDSVVHNDDEDTNEVAATTLTQSPGFRESVPSIRTDTTQSPKDVEVALSPPLIHESEERTIVTDSSVKQDKTHLYIPEGLETHSKSGSSFASFQTASSNVAFKSPLDPTPPPPVERSITGFSIGGEALGGWHTHTEEHTPWHQSDVVPTTPLVGSATVAADEDSDDDKPLQALQEKQQREVSTVRFKFSLRLPFIEFMIRSRRVIKIYSQSSRSQLMILKKWAIPFVLSPCIPSILE